MPCTVQCTHAHGVVECKQVRDSFLANMNSKTGNNVNAHGFLKCPFHAEHVSGAENEAGGGRKSGEAGAGTERGAGSNGRSQPARTYHSTDFVLCCLQSTLSVFTLTLHELALSLVPTRLNLLPITQPKAFLTRPTPSRRHNAFSRNVSLNDIVNYCKIKINVNYCK